MNQKMSIPLRAFDPWIGEKYRGTGFKGKKILVLGESQYDTDEDQPRPGIRDNENDRCSTIKIVEDLGINADRKYRRSNFLTKIAKLFLGYSRAPTDAERTDFWHQVSFYNYVQWWLPDSGVRPTPQMWRAAQAPFLEVMQLPGPNLVLVLGRDLENSLPRIPTDSSVVLIIPHPSSYGWTYEPWATQIAQAVG